MQLNLLIFSKAKRISDGKVWAGEVKAVPGSWRQRRELAVARVNEGCSQAEVGRFFEGPDLSLIMRTRGSATSSKHNGHEHYEKQVRQEI